MWNIMKQQVFLSLVFNDYLRIPCTHIYKFHSNDILDLFYSGFADEKVTELKRNADIL